MSRSTGFKVRFNNFRDLFFKGSTPLSYGWSGGLLLFDVSLYILDQRLLVMSIKEVTKLGKIGSFLLFPLMVRNETVYI